MRNSNTSVEHFHLGRLTSEIDAGKIAIPEFQRDFDWNESDIRSLLSTVFAGWPAGSLLFLEPGEDLFKLRELEGAPKLKKVELVVLDGQQRLTSLYQSLYEKGDVVFAIRWDVPVEEEIDESLVSFRKAVWDKRYSKIKQQVENNFVPVSALRSASDFFEWRDSALDVVTADKRDELRDELTSLYKEKWSAIHDYEFPVVRIDRKVNPSAISRIFEKVNKTGMNLNTFDLMVAKTFSTGWNLRDQWLGAREGFPELNDFFEDDGLPILQSISLKVKHNLRQAGVLSLSKNEVHDLWWDACAAAARSLEFLRTRCGVISADVLPYANILPPFIALEMNEVVSRRPDFCERWFWNAGFGGLYDVAANTRLVKDYKRILEGEEDFFDIEKTPLTPSLSTRKTQRSVWAAVACAIVREVEDKLGHPLSREQISDCGFSTLFTEHEITASIGKRIGALDVSTEFRGAFNTYLLPKRYVSPARKAGAIETIELCESSEFGEVAWLQLADASKEKMNWRAFRKHRTDWLAEFLARKGVRKVEILLPLP